MPDPLGGGIDPLQSGDQVKHHHGHHGHHHHHGAEGLGAANAAGNVPGATNQGGANPITDAARQADKTFGA